MEVVEEVVVEVVEEVVVVVEELGSNLSVFMKKKYQNYKLNFKNCLLRK